MGTRISNETGESTLLFGLGFGNRLVGATEGWVIDRLTDAEYRVHAIQFATDIADFEQEYLIPVQRVHDETTRSAC